MKKSTEEFFSFFKEVGYYENSRWIIIIEMIKVYVYTWKSRGGWSRPLRWCSWTPLSEISLSTSLILKLDIWGVKNIWRALLNCLNCLVHSHLSFHLICITVKHFWVSNKSTWIFWNEMQQDIYKQCPIWPKANRLKK